MSKTVRVPARFFDDHCDRDLDEGCNEVSRNSKGVLVEFTDAAFAELLSDANYYATGFTGEDAAEIRGLIASARATVKTLQAVR